MADFTKFRESESYRYIDPARIAKDRHSVSLHGAC